jgi:hypothetical protein
MTLPQIAKTRRVRGGLSADGTRQEDRCRLVD